MQGYEEMARKKEPTNGEIMAKEIIAKYKPKTVEDMQNALMMNKLGKLFN